MKTLYYNVILKENGNSRTDGFIAIKSESNKIQSIEGILTLDYLKASASGDCLVFEYYSTVDILENGFVLRKVFEIPYVLEDFKVPIHLLFSIKSREYDLCIKKEITDVKKQNTRREQLEMFKLNSVFTAGRD